MTRSRCAWAAVLLAALTGCDARSSLVPVTGRVVFRDGRPVPAGVIEFAPVNGGAAARSAIGKAGAFDLDTDGRRGAAVGEHRVAILQTVLLDGHAAHVRRHADFPVTHPKYLRFETSGLKREVRAGTANDFVIEVETGRH